MATTQNMSNYNAILKEYYVPDRVSTMILSSSPAMAMMPKKEVEGADWARPIIYAGTAGRSGTFNTALTNKGQTASVKFQITQYNDYALASVDRKTMLASKGNLGAFLPAAKTNIDAAIMQLRKSLAICLYRDGSGWRGQISTLTSGNTVITLVNVTDGVNFQVGDIIQLAAAKTGGSVRSGTATITAVDRNAGTLTFGSDITVSISGAAAGDYIFASGDYGIMYPGLEAWAPTTAPSSTSFFGVNRTIDSMLSATRFDGTGLLRYEALIEAQSQTSAIGDGRPTHAFCNPVDFRQLVLELEAQVRRFRDADVSVPVRKGSNAAVGFTGIIIQGDAGTIQVFPDRFCLPNRCYILQLEDWTVAHMGPELVSLVSRASDEGMLVETTSDGYEVRVTSYPSLSCAAPGRSAVLYNWGA